MKENNIKNILYLVLSLIIQTFLVINGLALIFFTDFTEDTNISKEFYLFMALISLEYLKRFVNKIYYTGYSFKYFNIINFTVVTISIITSVLITNVGLTMYNAGFLLFVILTYVYFFIIRIYERNEILKRKDYNN